MGTQFAFIYDIIILAVVGGMIFAGVKKGFASVIVSIAAVFVAFLCAMMFSAPISEAIYNNFIEKPVSEAVDSALDESMGAITLSGMDEVDYDMDGNPVLYSIEYYVDGIIRHTVMRKKL